MHPPFGFESHDHFRWYVEDQRRRQFHQAAASVAPPPVKLSPDEQQAAEEWVRALNEDRARDAERKRTEAERVRAECARAAAEEQERHTNALAVNSQKADQTAAHAELAHVRAQMAAPIRYPTWAFFCVLFVVWVIAFFLIASANDLGASNSTQVTLWWLWGPGALLWYVPYRKRSAAVTASASDASRGRLVTDSETPGLAATVLLDW